jgi:glycosyltransferase involved in cell wall biosynthesis
MPYPDIFVSVAIPTRNRSQKIENTLRSILVGSRCPDEILVVDQSDDDLTRILVGEMRLNPMGDRIRHISSVRRGTSANRNDGLREVNGDIIVFSDDDICVDKRWLELMLHEWIVVWRRQPVVITGRILPGPEFKSGAPVPGLRLSKDRMVFQGRPRFGDILYGGHFGASRELFARLGPTPFDEKLGPGAQFPGAEDEDFGYRVLKAGFPIVYEPSIEVTHHPEMHDYRRTSYTHGIGGGAFVAKHALQGDIGILGRLVHGFIVNLMKSARAYLRLQELEGSIRLFNSLGLMIGFLQGMLVMSRGQVNSVFSRLFNKRPNST